MAGKKKVPERRSFLRRSEKASGTAFRRFPSQNTPVVMDLQYLKKISRTHDLYS
jgi:hypothetical protein